MTKLQLPKGWDDEDLDERVRAITSTDLGPLLKSPEAIQFLLTAVRATQTEFEQRRSALVHRAEQARQELLAARDASASMEVVDELVRETSALNADLGRKHKGTDLTRQVNQLIAAQKKDRSQQALRKVQQARQAIQASKKGSWLLRLWRRWRRPTHSIDIVLRSVTGARKQLRRDIATAMRSAKGPLASYLGRTPLSHFTIEGQTERENR